MNTLRIRVASVGKVEKDAKEFPFVLQISWDSLTWFSVRRFKDFDSAMGAGRDLLALMRSSLTIRVENEIWKDKV